MLILSRKVDEKIIIRDDIVITIVGVTGDTVKIGIDAPKSVKVYRAEVYEEIMKSNIEAAQAASKTVPDLKTLKDIGEIVKKKKE